jgi:nitronate monooxygenase
MARRSVLETSLTQRLGIDVPIIQAPIGRVSGPELAAAVSNAGGLGMLGVTYLEPDDLRRAIRTTRELTDRPFGVNLILQWDQRERLSICLEDGVRIVSFHCKASLEDEYVNEPHEAGALVMHTIGSAEEGRRAADGGVDVLVAQGLDAGGHVWGSVGTLSLIPAVVDAVGSTPVVAAGGIGDGRGLTAVLALGAQAGWMGTRFVVAEEALSHPDYRARILAATETDAVWSTGVFDLGFPVPVRTLENTTLRAWKEAGSPPAGERPGEGEPVARRPDGESILRYDFAPPVEGMTGDTEAMANHAGQSVGVVRRVQPARDIVRETAQQAMQVLAGMSPE